MEPDSLLTKLESLPARPGCYLFKDRQGRILYVGKATSLRSRVRSYFQESSSDTRAFLPLLRRSVADVDTVVTASEKEAAILEASLVKQHRPRYNVKLRDDKSYLSLRLDIAHPFPRLELVRRPMPDGARYFGPHHSATEARRTLGFLNKHFLLRTCTDAELGARKRPCLQYHIRRCPGPCVLPVDRDLYGANVRAAAMFLDGRHDELLADLDGRMREASRAMGFELAATYRDQLVALRAVRERQRVVTLARVSQDAIGLHRDGDLCEVAVAFVRSGRVIDTITVAMRRVEVPDEEVVGAFLAHFYGEEGPAAHALPDEVLLPVLPEGATGVEQWLGERRGRRVRLLRPRRGPRAELVRLAADNAAHAFSEKRRAALDIEQRLADIQDRLRLPCAPRVIECCDISHLGGGDTVGAIVRMVDGEQDKTGYRTFHVRSVADGDDYQAMFEVLARRFRRARDAAARARAPEADTVAGGAVGGACGGAEPDPLPEDSPGTVEEAPADAASRAPAEPWQAPDLLVVDGGRGQLSAALAAARDLGLHELAIVALAKQRELGAGEVLADRVFLPGQKNGIPVRPHTALVLLARARDEAHRFANRARERLGKARRLRSGLEGVAGIGEATRRKLLARFGGPRAIREATDEQLAAEAGLGSAQIDALRRHLASIFEAELDETAAEVPSDRAGGRGEGGEPHGR